MEVRKQFVAEAMESWTTLNEALMQMNEEEVLFALELENDRVEPRQTFMKRLNQRYNGIKTAEVRRELDDD